ncbi:hypothetical protein BDK51DRAFT_51298 [Blyttiomyces helicus]|uniref:Uncharacterized protein n=1 Tax=Blyttiomyces helicus TaxID=388810 RepID=A0A4P9VXY8_9FUNG|nr:hypothetical protein BDK51DRAFT_51298 [Blyttiomyces helicus]|eukprot:RKO84112.1 hypothetical protein BDK51DRAFT_51298 [Blyttiomyces helicus]
MVENGRLKKKLEKAEERYRDFKKFQLRVREKQGSKSKDTPPTRIPMSPSPKNPQLALESFLDEERVLELTHLDALRARDASSAAFAYDTLVDEVESMRELQADLELENRRLRAERDDARTLMRVWQETCAGLRETVAAEGERAAEVEEERGREREEWERRLREKEVMVEEMRAKAAEEKNPRANTIEIDQLKHENASLLIKLGAVGEENAQAKHDLQLSRAETTGWIEENARLQAQLDAARERPQSANGADIEAKDAEIRELRATLAQRELVIRKHVETQEENDLFNEKLKERHSLEFSPLFHADRSVIGRAQNGVSRARHGGGSGCGSDSRDGGGDLGGRELPRAAASV